MENLSIKNVKHLITPNEKYIYRIHSAYILSNIFFISFDMKAGISLVTGDILFRLDNIELAYILSIFAYENNYYLRIFTNRNVIGIDSTAVGETIQPRSASYTTLIIPILRY